VSLAQSSSRTVTYAAVQQMEVMQLAPATYAHHPPRRSEVRIWEIQGLLTDYYLVHAAANIF